MPFWIVRPIFWVLLRIAFALFGGIRFEGREHVPLQGGVMITPNHISDCDPAAIGVALPRACYVMAKEELFAMRWLGPIIRALHGFPVKRYTADRAALRYAEDLLKKNECVVIFPEGKLSEDGKLQPILPGALLIAERAKVPIVPTIILHSDDLMPYGKTKPRFIKQPVIVRFGPPVTVEELKGGGKGGEALKRGAERLGVLMRAVQENKPYPPAEPPPPRKSSFTPATTTPADPEPTTAQEEDVPKEEEAAKQEDAAVETTAPAEHNGTEPDATGTNTGAA